MPSPLHNWNSRERLQGPLVVDATLAELASDPQLPSPTWDQARQWMTRGRQLGIHHFELMTVAGAQQARQADHWLQQANQEDRLILTVRDPWPLESWMPQHPGLEIRWIPASPEADLSTCARLTRAGVPVWLVVPQAGELDPIRLNRLVLRARQVGIDGLELNGRHGTPGRLGLHSLLEFVRGILGERGPELAWSSDHGYGLALSQALDAWREGVQRVRCSLLGCGPQGNVPLELLLVNLEMEEPGRGRLDTLTELCRYGEETFDLEISTDYPIFGRDAFASTTSDRLEAPLPARQVGRNHRIEIGPRSSRGSLLHWLGRHGLNYSPATVEVMLEEIRGWGQVLCDLELIDLYHSLVSRP